MTDKRTGEIVWIETPAVPLDFGGPQNVPYTPLPDRPEDALGISLIQRIGEIHPDKIAVDDGVVQLTYVELLDRVYGLARQIGEVVAPGGVVASVVHNGAIAPVVIIAAVTAGYTLAPIDAAHPRERQAALFAETGASAVIVATDVALDDSFIPAHIPRIRCDVTRRTGAPAFHHAVDPGATLMVMFTSGSTGRPKGLAMGVANAGRSMKEFVDRFHINANDVIAGLASLSQGGSVGVIALATGARLRIIDMARVGILETLRVMRDERVSVLSFVPSVLRTFMELPGGEQAFSSLRVLDLHGERILASDIRLFRAKLPPDCCISITYGATETGAVTSWFVDDKIDGAVAPIGYPVPGKQVAILDEAGDPAAPGEIGELITRGEMASGSWQGGRMTTARFIFDPADPSKLIYPMGDQVRMRSDGLFEFIGRRDRQVKVLGQWADLGEVEAALRAAAGVADAVVIAHARPGQADTLAAFVTVEDETHAPSAAALRRAVAQATAEHMVPGDIRFLPAIPRLANFKPDLVRLAQMLS